MYLTIVGPDHIARDRQESLGGLVRLTIDALVAPSLDGDDSLASASAASESVCNRFFDGR